MKLLPAGNENLILDRRTPAETLQIVRRVKRRHAREIAEDPQLWSNPRHRADREFARAIEQIARRRTAGGR